MVLILIPRRKVLGAVAAIWSMSWTEQIQLYHDDKSTPDKDDDKKTYPRREVISNLYGSATAYHTGPHCTDFQIGIYPHQAKPVSIEIDTDVVTAGVVMDGEEATQLATKLLDAIEEIDKWRDTHDYSVPLENLRRD